MAAPGTQFSHCAPWLSDLCGRRLAAGRVAIALAVLLPLALVACADRHIGVKDRPVAVLSETEGQGTPVKPGDFVTVTYFITTLDGREIQRYDGYRFQVGAGTVVLGMDEAVVGMKPRGRRVVEVPPHKHWGRRGYGEGPTAIPPAARLIFDIELIEVRPSTLTRVSTQR